MVEPAYPSIEADLRIFEGDKLFPYPDQYGNMTIGIGRNLTKKGLRPIEKEFLFQNDLQDSHSEVSKVFPWAEGVVYAVLVQMVFQMGLPSVLGFHNSLQALQAKDYPSAATHLAESKWATRDTPIRAHVLIARIRALGA